MSEKGMSIEEVREDLSKCESRLNELVASGKSVEGEGDLEKLNSELKSCKLELNELENKSGDEWEDAKFDIVKRLGDVKKSLGLSPREMV